MSYLSEWLSNSEENQRVFNQESLMTDVSESLHELMNFRNITQKDIAEKLGVSKARISKLFGSANNMTLKTLADICFALGVEPKFEFAQKEPEVLLTVNLSNANYAPIAKPAQRYEIKLVSADYQNAA